MYNNQEKVFIAIFGWFFASLYKVFLWFIWLVLLIVSPLTIAYKNARIEITKRFNEIK